MKIKKFPVSTWPFRSPCPWSDKEGNLILFANGCEIYNIGGSVLNNGNHITPDNWVYDGYCPDYYPFAGSWLFLPDPASDSLFYLFGLGHRESTGAGIYGWGLYASHLSGQEVFEKNTLICADSLFRSHLTACRHANGRDWWLVLNKVKTNSYYKYLLDPFGIHFMNLQDIGMPTSWEGSATGQCAFSPSGETFIHYDNVSDMYVYDFDRCSGELSNFRPISIEHNEDTGNSLGGMAISPNSRFVYTFGYLYSYQVDLQASNLQASVTQVAYWDSTYVNNVWPTVFGKAALAPNGKIYAAIPGSNTYLHVIHNPNAKGDSCQFEQHGLFLPYSWNVNDIVNFPNFRLGKKLGSACDTVYTGVKETSVGMDIQVFPNPAFSHVNISLLAPAQGQWSLTDVSGKRVQAGTWEGLSLQIEVESLPSGLYFFQLRRKNGSVYAGKVAVQRKQ
ncbi:MAG: T9SS type A sorting domain-containing protein [Phycisphaerae bacterium]|nr:T9SS type A sorting domain-containing protein [Saprospiraceae bacterium]